MEDQDELATSELKNFPDLLWLVLGLQTPQLIPSATVWRAGTNAAGGASLHVHAHLWITDTSVRVVRRDLRRLRHQIKCYHLGFVISCFLLF